MTLKSSRYYFSVVLVSLVGAITSTNTIAIPVFQNSAVVNNVTNSATFDSITSNGISLSGYTEDGIIVDVPDVSFIGFDAFNTGSVQTAFQYGSGGNFDWVTISMADGSLISALDFLLGDGYLQSTTNLIWETFVGSTSTGFGDLVLNKGTTVGWTDTSGFTSIRVAAHVNNIDAFGQYQAIALDDINISTATSVPEPTILALMALGLAGIGLTKRKQA